MRTTQQLMTILGAGIVSAAFLGAAGTSAAWADYVPTSGNGTVTASDACVGTSVTFAADGFAPSSTVAITGAGAEGTFVVADASGKASYVLSPAQAGTYTLTATGQTPPPGDAARTVTATVTASDCPAGATGPAAPAPGTGAEGGSAGSGSGDGSESSASGAAAGGLARTGATSLPVLLSAAAALLIAGLGLVSVPALRRRSARA
ncbi:hypothetical protein [Motilibacter deserti]|uniref:Uncharacterized protein n=1 Tax=Motilibacter deserti TaxID=2714956 RepID=A0ABX0GU26_9ACTN|nr:hypothetical protein [Motilibacter deserti]NHC14397.1 hypothetical protein [Motilibacter deserti]